MKVLSHGSPILHYYAAKLSPRLNPLLECKRFQSSLFSLQVFGRNVVRLDPMKDFKAGRLVAHLAKATIPSKLRPLLIARSSACGTCIVSEQPEQPTIYAPLPSLIILPNPARFFCQTTLPSTLILRNPSRGGSQCKPKVGAASPTFKSQARTSSTDDLTCCVSTKAGQLSPLNTSLFLPHHTLQILTKNKLPST